MHVLVFTCVVGGVNAEATRVPEDEAQTLIETLSVGLQQWEREVSVHSTYTFRIGTATAPVDLTTGEFEAQRVSKVARGVLHKLGSKERISIQYEGGVQMSHANAENGPQSGSRLATNTPRDVVRDGTSQVSYIPLAHAELDGKQRLYGGAVDVKSLQDVDPGNSFQSGGILLLVTPLHLTKLLGQTLERLDVVSGVTQVGSLRRQAFRLPGDEVEVLLEGTTSRGQQTSRLIFWMQPFPPVLKSVVRRMSDVEERFVFADFRECPGGYFPRRAVMTIQHLSDRERPIMFKEWVSTDLGEQQPTSDDFVLSLPASTRIRGLKVLPPIKVDVRKLDIDDVQKLGIATLPQDLGAVIDPSAPPKNRPQGGANWWPSWFLFNLVFVAVAAVVYALSTRSRKPRSA